MFKIRSAVAALVLLSVQNIWAEEALMKTKSNDLHGYTQINHYYIDKISYNLFDNAIRGMRPH